MSKLQVICIGEALIDKIINRSDSTFKNYLGGAPANVVCALAKLNIPSSFIGCLGDDDYGQEFINLFDKLNVNTSFLQIAKKTSTRVIKVTRDKMGDRSFSGFENQQSICFADQLINKVEIQKNLAEFKKLFKNTKYIVIGSNILSYEKSSESLFLILDYAKEMDIKIIIDVNWREIFWRNSRSKINQDRTVALTKIRKLLDKADILKLASEEAKLFFETNDPYEISQKLVKKPEIIVTDGPNPICWYINGLKGENDVINSDLVVDTTGAGDSFLAGLISQFCANSNFMDKLTIKKCIQFASVCGYLTCLGEGAIEPQPRYEEVYQFLDNYGSHI
tara:strand:+ start:2004 stop:3008 length:1005 start_codon:yes stop_codon:yes gene_type:complete